MPDADWTMPDLTKPETTRLDSLHHPKTVQVCVQHLNIRTNSLTELNRMLARHRITSNECSAKPRSHSMSKLDVCCLTLPNTYEGLFPDLPPLQARGGLHRPPLSSSDRMPRSTRALKHGYAHPVSPLRYHQRKTNALLRHSTIIRSSPMIAREPRCLMVTCNA